MDYLGTLNGLAPKFKVSSIGGSGLEPQLKIDPPPEALDLNGLALSETVQKVAQVDVPLKIDLAFLGKWVRSGNSDLPPDPATENPIGGMPVVEQLVTPTGLTSNLPPAQLMTSDPGQGTVPGVPEVLGRIKGTVTQTVEKLTDVLERRPITLAVRWRVFDESTPGVSSPASSVQYRTDPSAGWQALPDPLVLPSGGVPATGTPMSLSLKFPAIFSELTSGAPDVMTFSVRASIKLSLGTNEVQLVSMGGTVTGGTFTLTFTNPFTGLTETTAAIPYNATAAAVQSALEALPGINPGDVSCTGGPLPGSPVTVTFQSSLAARNIAQMTGTPSLTGTGPTLTVSTATEGAAGVVETAWVDLPAVPLVVPTIPVPTILVLCEHQNFAGRRLVLVPSNSLLGAASGSGGIGVGTALGLTNSALQSFAAANALIGFLAASSGTTADTAANVLKALASSPGQTIIAALSRVDNLSANEFVFDPGGWLGVGRFTGDNMASSIICIGRPSTTFDFFQDPNLNERITRLQVTLDGSLGCAIRKLDLLDPSPDVVYGASITSFSPGWSHEDRITSLAFAGPSARFLPA